MRKREPAGSGEDSRSTRRRLTETAIDLFGERGVYGASLREISERAGAKNTAAAHYHFGDRRGLIVAAVDCVVGECSILLNFEQARDLGIDFQPRDSVVWRIIAHAMLPYVTLPLRKGWGYNGIRLLSRLITVEGTEFAPELESRLQPGGAELAGFLAAHVPGLEPGSLTQRIDFMFVNCICGTAAFPYVTAVSEAGLTDRRSAAEFFVQLTDYVAGGILAGMNN